MVLLKNIRELRFKNGEMTQRELAEQAGVSRQTINAIESNKHSPTIEDASRIADVFREDISDVFSYEYNGNPDFMIVKVEIDRGSDR